MEYHYFKIPIQHISQIHYSVLNDQTINNSNEIFFEILRINKTSNIQTLQGGGRN